MASGPSSADNAPSDKPDRGSDDDKPDRSNANDKTDKDDFDNALSNAERPDRAPAATTDIDTDPDDDEDDARAMDNTNRPDRAPATPPDVDTDPDENEDQDEDRAASPTNVSPAPDTLDLSAPEEEEDQGGFLDDVGEFFGGLAEDLQDFARENPRVDGSGNVVGLVDADGIQRGEVASRVMSSGMSSDQLAAHLGFDSPQEMSVSQNAGFIETKYQEDLVQRAVNALTERYGPHPDLPSLLQTAGLLSQFAPEDLISQFVPEELTSRGIAETTLSEMGLEFIAEGEMLAGVSNDLHHPTQGSGVTLGAGYDMGGRTQQEVAADLIAAGIDPQVAATLSRGAGLTGDEAADFVNSNQGFVDLNREQQIELARNEMTDYVGAVQEAFSDYDLSQNQFDALVSFSYNLGAGVFDADVNPQLAAAVESGDLNEVTGMMERFVYSGGQRIEGLVNRRAAEIELMNTPDAQ